MKIPLHYQITECDCGPTSVLNAVSLLFDREDIPPEFVKSVMHFLLDCNGEDGTNCTGGTSCKAMNKLCCWINKYASENQFPINCNYIPSSNVSLDKNKTIVKAVSGDSVAVLRLYFDVWHYVVLTKIENNMAYLFDPYYKDGAFKEPDILLDHEHIFEYNRIVPLKYFDCEQNQIYALGETDKREAVIFSRTDKIHN